MPGSAARVLRVLADDEQTDAELLARFVDRRDEAAFALLVRRHGRMVYGVCRRLLPEPDAEDAFQATFLVLAEKARTAAPREVANWLYGVARRAALLSRRSIARRREKAGALPDRPAPAPTPMADLQSALDEELGRLPDAYRAVIILCDLEERTRREAAAILGWPEGTVAGRLVRGREMLAKRLARHAPTVSVAAALSGTASARVPEILATTSTVPSVVTALAHELLFATARGKLMKAATVLLLLGCAGFGVVLHAGQKPAPDQPVAPVVAKAPVKPAKTEEAFTAWGKEVNGLQAGLGFPAGQKRAYVHGETITLVVRVRNVGKETAKFEYIRQFLDENPPGVTGADGKVIPQARSEVMGQIHAPVAVTLEPGKDVVLESRIHGAAGVPYVLRPVGGGNKAATKNHPLRVGTGMVTLGYDRVFGDSSIGRLTIDPGLAGLATGKLEIEVTDVEKGPIQLPTNQGFRELKGKEREAYETTNAWLEERLKEAHSIKAGSTYADVCKYFRVDGGLAPVGKGRYVNVLCPLMKIDVEFERVKSDTLPATAKVTKVSRPYFEREFMD